MTIFSKVNELKKLSERALKAYVKAKVFDFNDIKKIENLGEKVGSLKGKSIFITGGSRGIGLAIALRAARDGACITIAAKTVDPHPKLEGTIHSAAEEIVKAGGKALPLQVDVRLDEQLEAALKKSAETFGGIDILINNASAIYLEKTPNLSIKQFDLMQSINTRATFISSKLCYPYLKNSKNPHILTLSPPLNINSNWPGEHIGYTLSKYGMSLCVLGLAQEWKNENIGVNALWPRTTIATAAIRNMPFGETLCKMSRVPEIMADAAYEILTRNSKVLTGNFFLDDEVLTSCGFSDMKKYSVDQNSTLQPDLFL